jgi:hemerythrin-like metal-binding protein
VKVSKPIKLQRLEWREAFSVGNPSIDHEHRELIALLNAIIDRLEEGGEWDAVADFLGEVNARISAHFALEEKIMREHRYDQLADHKGDHERLLDDIRDIMDAFEQGSTGERRGEFAERLREWFLIHSKTRDARLHRKLRR